MRPRLHLRKLGDLAAQGKTTWDHGPDMMNELRNARFWEQADINVAVVDAGVLRYDLDLPQPRRTPAILLSRYVSDFRALHFRRVPAMLQQREHQWPAAAVFPEGDRSVAFLSGVSQQDRSAAQSTPTTCTLGRSRILRSACSCTRIRT